MESSVTTIAPLLLRNLLTSIFIYADNSMLNLTEKYKLLQLLRSLFISAFLFFLGLLPSFFSFLNLFVDNYNFSLKARKSDNYLSTTAGGGDSGIARALSQLLSIVNDIPVGSRKYEIVRSLAERIINENLEEDCEALREVNCAVLTAAFSRTLSRLEAAVTDQERSRNGIGGGGGGGGTDDVTEGARKGDSYRLNRFLRSVWYYGDMAWTWIGKSREDMSCLGSSAEKLAAELLWLAQKLAACGSEEAVCMWASASNLAWLALSAEPRLQGSLVKISAFLFKQAKDMGLEEDEESKKELQRQTKMKMLMSWLPLLCRASNGTDAPVLSIGERAELEKVLEDSVESLEEEDYQEKVLSLWLHHFTHCPSDWPNLLACYTRWCAASRKLLLLQ
ncbi:hypothetical protein F0562_020396 [Nyssa sinensis]|uniref:Uncharacterized protein n=1 Tax=Nyssa sinensis TaxID=561372 RepID=A0A5J5BVJ7_9ASTE|nr:hypothetical protein F0562_020396 [Nyssa sinensis]